MFDSAKFEHDRKKQAHHITGLKILVLIISLCDRRAVMLRLTGCLPG